MEIPGVWEGTKRLFRTIAPAFDPRTEYPKVPVQKINAQRLAQHILDFPTANSQPFSRDFILNTMGYKPNLEADTTDYMDKYPKEYRALNKALRELTDAGILRQEATEEPNEYGERDKFWVEDMEKLKGFASTPTHSQ